MPSRKPAGIAIVGAGMAAKPHFSALDELAQAGRVSVRGVLTRSPATRERIAADRGWRAYDDLAQIAADADVDAVLVLTPPNQRLDLVRALAAAGKHMLIEKPVERTAAAAAHIVETCDRAGVRLGVVLQHRFREGVRRLAEIRAQGLLGTPYAAAIDIPWWRPQSYYDEPGRGSYERDGGGVLISQAIHTLDLALQILGPAAEVQVMAGTTTAHRMEAEDFVAGGIRFANGALASLAATTAAYPGRAESIDIHCPEGSARLESSRLTLSWRDGRVEEWGEGGATGAGADPMAFPHGWHKAVIADFLDAVAEDRQPTVSGASALEVQRLIEALVASSTQGRRVTLA